MSEIKVYIVIAVFNRVKYTDKCIQLLKLQTYNNFEIIIVDDNSTDGTKGLISEKYPEVTILSGNGELYWTGSMALGVDYVLKNANPLDYILVLNDDLVFEIDLIEQFLKVAEKNPKSLIQALGSWVDDKNKIQFAGKKMNWWTGRASFFHIDKKISDFPKNHIEISSTLSGRGVLVPIQAIVDAGNYSTRYQQSGDPEFTRRLAKAGYNLLVSFNCIVYSYRKVGKGNINEREVYYLKDLKEYFGGVLSQARIKTMYLNACSYGNGFLQSTSLFIFNILGMSWNFIKKMKLF
jgi:GT2 family glycosyltransferase